jgi:hypothetical protein
VQQLDVVGAVGENDGGLRFDRRASTFHTDREGMVSAYNDPGRQNPTIADPPRWCVSWMSDDVKLACPSRACHQSL